MMSSVSTPSRTTYACIRCAERKVKCDRQRPCGACLKHNMDCVFNAPKLPRKKHKRVKVQLLADRLNLYESLLQEHGIDASKLPTVTQLPSRSSDAATTNLKDTQPQTLLSLEPDTTRSQSFPRNAPPRIHD